MTPRSPIEAILWETWRVTRVEIAWKLGLAIAGSLGTLTVFAAFAPNNPGLQGFGAAIALVIIVFPQFAGWFSMAKINGGRPGYPLYLLFSQPVRTAALVGIPMAYLMVVPAAMYLASALILRWTSGYPFPLLPVAVWIAALSVFNTATHWSARNKVVQLLVTMAASISWVTLADHRLNAVEIRGSFDWPPHLWSSRFDFPFTDYLFIAAVAAGCFAVALTRVARQRHGDATAGTPWGAGFPDWLVQLFRLPCPTSSAIRAQVWYDLKSSGLPVLAIGLVLAILNPLVFAASTVADGIRPVAITFGLGSVVTVLILGPNAFGIRFRRGRVYASPFEVTQACPTAALAGLRVLVRSVCMLVALVAVLASLWASLSLVAVGRGYEPLRSVQRASEAAVGAMTGHQQVALVVVASIGVAIIVASLASFLALGARYPRRSNIATGSVLLLHVVVLSVLAATQGHRGLRLFIEATRWVDAPALVLATIYVSWRAFAERLLTLWSACGALLISAAFGAAWLTLLRAAGVQLSAISATDAVWMSSPALLPLMAAALAPWSLSRIRHT